MTFIDEIKQFSQKITVIKHSLKTEEATKTSLILPFIQILGYDVFNPFEVIPEFTADVGIKKGEKVDYAIMQNNEPIIIIEAKECSSDLGIKNLNQLYRYFSSTKAKFGILTNGIIYKIYTDLDKPNIMDSIPFLEIDLLNITNKEIIELNRFAKEVFDIKQILNSASELRYKRLIKKVLIEQIQNSSESFINAVLNKDIYCGITNQNIINKFEIIVKNSFDDYVHEFIDKKLQNILDNSNQLNKIENIGKRIDKVGNQELTSEEFETLSYIKNMIKGAVDEELLIMKKIENHACLQVGDNVGKWICRILITQNNKTFIIHKFKEETYEDTYFYTDYEQLTFIKDLIIQVANNCENN